MGKRQVKNESALKEIRLPEEGELFGRVLKMMGGENVMIKCDDNITTVSYTHLTLPTKRIV